MPGHDPDPFRPAQTPLAKGPQASMLRLIMSSSPTGSGEDCDTGASVAAPIEQVAGELTYRF